MLDKYANLIKENMILKEKIQILEKENEKRKKFLTIIKKIKEKNEHDTDNSDEEENSE